MRHGGTFPFLSSEEKVKAAVLVYVLGNALISAFSLEENSSEREQAKQTLAFTSGYSPNQGNTNSYLHERLEVTSKFLGNIFTSISWVNIFKHIQKTPILK